MHCPFKQSNTLKSDEQTNGWMNTQQKIATCLTGAEVHKHAFRAVSNTGEGEVSIQKGEHGQNVCNFLLIHVVVFAD